MFLFLVYYVSSVVNYTVVLFSTVTFRGVFAFDLFPTTAQLWEIEHLHTDCIVLGLICLCFSCNFHQVGALFCENIAAVCAHLLLQQA